MKLFNTVAVAACLCALAGTASATAFSITSATFSPGSGYGIDASETSSPTLLDVRFNSAAFSLQNFNLNAINAFQEFTVGVVNFQEANAGGGIVAAERDNLDVSLALNFALPGSVSNLITATGSATLGSVSDDAIDYTLTWSPLTRSFGTSGAYTISLDTLNFTETGRQTLTGRVTLTALDGARAVPEPGTLAMLGIGALAAAALRRRSRA